jgi:NAD(P)-dependent dehydrogenase (short-subunit alcohol dehydrogenase family)
MAAIADVSTHSISDLISLKGRNAVVTGAAKGLGRAIARRLAEAGASVLMCDIDEEQVEASAKSIAHETGARLVAMKVDVRDGSSISSVANYAVDTFGQIDIWVNNAGIYPSIPVLEMIDADWDGVLDINLRGTFIGCREAAKRMASNGSGGVIINLSSTSGFNGGGPSLTHYTASKHGVNGITKQMALELASQQIRVLGVAPTIIVTDGLLETMGGAAAATGFELGPNYTMLGRAGVPDDVARVVLFCASDLSLFMTGSILPVDAGLLTR